MLIVFLLLMLLYDVAGNADVGVAKSESWHAANVGVALPRSMPPLRLHVVDKVERVTTQLDGGDPTGTGCLNRCGMFAMETLIHRALLSSAVDSLRVSSVRGADVIFVPAYANCFAKMALKNGTVRYSRKGLEMLYKMSVDDLMSRQLLRDEFERRRGHSFLWSVPNGMGRLQLAVNLPHWSAESALVSNGDCSQRDRYRPETDIVVPGRLEADVLALGTSHRSMRSVRERSLLAVFSGIIDERNYEYSSGTRQAFLRASGSPTHGDRVRIYNRADKSGATGRTQAAAFVRDALDAIFCLCPPGWALWTPRPVQALMLGCIPVILGDSLALPFANLFDWSTFSIKLPESDAERIADVLGELERNHMDHLVELQRNVIRVRTHFHYYERKPGQLGYGLLHSLLWSLFQQQATDRAHWQHSNDFWPTFQIEGGSVRESVADLDEEATKEERRQRRRSRLFGLRSQR
jgi:Exostosin family